MNNNDKYLYWLDIAEYDLVTAESMLNSSRYVYVAFMCQQALEKLSKGLYNYYVDDEIPRVHNISFIFNRIVDKIDIDIEDEKLDLFDKLSAYYIQGRYPTFKEKISQAINETEAKVLLDKTKEVFEWMKSLKK